MGRRDLLSNTIYQRMKQLQNRLKKRNQEEEQRRERAERSKTARWEEHQKHMLQFETYLKRCAQAPKRRRPETQSRVPPNTAMSNSLFSGEEINLDHVQLLETQGDAPSFSSSRTSRRSPAISLPLSGGILQEAAQSSGSMIRKLDQKHEQTDRACNSTPSPSLTERNPSPHLSLSVSPPTVIQYSSVLQLDYSPLSQVTENDGKGDNTDQDWYTAGWQSPSSRDVLTNDEVDLGRGSGRGSDMNMKTPSTPKSLMSSEMYSGIMSPPPTLPSTTACSESPFLQTPIPPNETPVIPFLSDFNDPEDIPEISITKMSSAPRAEESKKNVKVQKKPKIKKKLKKKTTPKVVKPKSPEEPEPNNQLELLKLELEEPIQSKKEAQQKIKEIFKSANTLPEEELTEEAFDVFLDTIKKLSEYLDQDEIDSDKYDVVDDISSGFTSRANDYLADDASGATLSPNKMFGDFSSTPDTFSDSKSKKSESSKRLKAEEKRKQRILVVKEKQEGIIRYRKVTMAELRLRRQRALMRARLKVAEDVMERERVHMQRMRLFEMAHLNEKERLARLEQFKLEEEQRVIEEAEMKRMKELKVKEELEQLLARSRQRQAEEQRLARLNSQWRGPTKEPKANQQTAKDVDSVSVSELNRRENHAKAWRSAARRAKNKERFENMIKKNSQTLYRTLVKELISQRQKSLITDIPGFSYFLFLKYTLDLDDINDIMSDL